MSRQVAVGGVAPVNPRRDKFVLDPCKIFSTKFGKLIPIFRSDVLPGDIWKISASTFIRSAPMVAPVMHEEVVQTYYFFVPDRIIWDNAEDFHTSGQNGEDVSVAPYFMTPEDSNDYTGTLYDHLGMPLFDAPTGSANIMPANSLKTGSLSIRAYWKIVEDWFRDSWIDSEIEIPTSDGDDSAWLFPASGVSPNIPFGKRWERDYFTSARPSPQLGVGVSLPLGSSAALVPNFAPSTTLTVPAPGSVSSVSAFQVGSSSGDVYLGAPGTSYGGSYVPYVVPSGTLLPQVVGDLLGSLPYDSLVIATSWSTGSLPVRFVLTSVSGTSYSFRTEVFLSNGSWYFILDVYPALSGGGATFTLTGTVATTTTSGVDLSSVSVDLSTATAAQVNDIRFAFQLQKFFERSARAGNRYVEHLLAHWGVRSPDMRLQRAEFIGGSSSVMSISEVLQTSSSTGTSAQGNMAGHGIGGTTARTLKYRASEHGWIIGLMVILPKTVYQQGLPRMFSRFSRFDYAYPEFVNIGEQAILNKELYADVDDETREKVFGYIGRYDEYRHMESYVSGDFRNKLDYWHLSRKFPGLPVLGPDFLNSDVDAPNGLGSPNRIFADQTEDTFWCHSKTIAHVVRSLPLTHQPGFIDHN
jgi:hypothetical protein